MDVNVVRELQAQMEEFNKAVANLGGSMAKMNSAVKESTNATTDATNTTNQNTQSVTKNTTGAQALKNAQDQSDRILKDAAGNFSRAIGLTRQALASFTDAVFSSQEGLSKYGNAADSLGQGALSIGKNFGLLGTVLGGAAALFGKAVGLVFQLDDNIVKFRDGFAKTSGVLPVTTTELGNLAKQSRFSLDDMQKLAKTTNSLGQSLLGLGGYAGQGAVKFMQMAAVSDDVRRQYGRMGISQAELLDSQAKYTQMQAVSGQAMANQRKSIKQLQKESLEYTDNLTRMSSLTGESKDKLQAERETAMLEYEEQLKITEENARIKELRATGRGAEAAQLEKEQAARKALIIKYTDLYGAEQGQLAGRVMRQGGYDDKTAFFKQRGEDMLGLTEQLKKSSDVEGDITKHAAKTDDLIKGAAQKFNQAGQFVGEAGIGNLVASKEALLRINKRAKNLVEAVKEIQKDMDTKKQAGKDPLADSIEDMRSFEREAKAKLQTFLESIDPLRGGLEMLKNAAYALVAAAGVAAAGAGVVKIFQMFKGGGGGAASGAAGAAAGAVGAGAAGAGAAGYVPGSIRKADLLDKRGRVLQGAALDARMKKLSGGTKLEKDDGTFGGVIDALKKAGSNSLQVIKGGGALAIAVTELGGGIAAATAMIGYSIIKFVQGMIELDKLDGSNLIQVGLGMAGLGTGILAMGASQVANALGNVISFFTGEDPLTQAAEMLTRLAAMNLNRKKIEDNASAFMAFAKAMTFIAGGNVASSIGGAVSAVFTSVSEVFGQTKLPVEEVIEFSQKKINKKQVENNSQALAAYGKAIASFKGYGNSMGAIGTAVATAASKFFKVDPPLQEAVYFSTLKIDEKKTKINATAFKLFSEAMASYKGGQGLLSAVSTIAAAKLNAIFGQDGAIDAFEKFSKKDFGRDAAKNAKAFLDFSTAMGILSNPGGYQNPSSTPTGPASPPGPAPAPVAKPTKKEMRGNAGLIYNEARRLGYDHNMAIAFVALAQKETGLNPRQSENLNYSAKRMRQVWPKLTEAQANAMAGNPQALANFVYGKINGNQGGNDGWVYRGRGFNGITGRGIYAKVGSKIGVDLVGNPDALYDPALAARAMFAFFADHPLVKGVKGARTQEDANRLITDANGGVKRGFSTRSKFGQENYAKVAQYAADWNAAGLGRPARKGGLFTGPSTGYPMELHGTEMVIPQMSPNSLLMKLAKTNTEVANMGEIMKMVQEGATGGAGSAKHDSGITFLNPEMIATLANKFDSVIDILSESDDLQGKILKHSSV